MFMQVETKDALLHAINEEYVEAVEVLLDHEESIHTEGEPWVKRITFELYMTKTTLELGGFRWTNSRIHGRHFPADPCGSHRQL